MFSTLVTAFVRSDGRGRRVATLAAAVAISIAGAAVAAAPIGVNLNSLTSRSTDIPFVDVFKTSAPWRPVSLDPTHSPQPPPLALDPDGWVARLEPGQGAITHVFDFGAGHYPGGIFSLFYDGQGDLEVAGSGVSVVSRKPGAMKVRVVPTAGPDGGIAIIERRTDSANPLRHIRLVLPGFETRYKTDPFNPTFLARLAPFRTIRFMEWDGILRSTATDWSDRRTPDYATQSLPDCCPAHRMTGVALEYQIDLANRLNADPWFSVPVMASDDYVARMATLIRDRLKPTLRPYVEYGNELWNPTFREGFNYVTKRGLAAGLSTDPKLAGRYQYVTRAAEVFSIWSRVFGPQSGRIHRVIAGKLNDIGFDEQALPYMKAHGWSADILTVGAYVSPRDLGTWSHVGPEFYDAILAMKPDDIVARMDQSISQDYRGQFQRQAAEAKRFGMTLAAYEGGQGVGALGMDPRHVAKYRDRVAAAFIAANRRPGMAKVYRDLFDTWFGAGGGLFLHQGFIGEPGWWGSWGLLEYQNQDPATAVKYRAVVDYIHAGRAGR